MHAVFATAHAKIDGHSWRLTDGIQRKRVKLDSQFMTGTIEYDSED